MDPPAFVANVEDGSIISESQQLPPTTDNKRRDSYSSQPSIISSGEQQQEPSSSSSVIEEDIVPAAEKKQIKGVLKKSKYSSSNNTATADAIVNEDDEEDGGSSQQSSIQLSGVYSTTSTNDGGESTAAFSNAGSSYSSAMYDGPYSMASTQKVANIIDEEQQQQQQERKDSSIIATTSSHGEAEKNVGAVEAKNQAANRGILELQEEGNNNNDDIVIPTSVVVNEANTVGISEISKSCFPMSERDEENKNEEGEEVLAKREKQKKQNLLFGIGLIITLILIFGLAFGLKKKTVENADEDAAANLRGDEGSTQSTPTVQPVTSPPWLDHWILDTSVSEADPNAPKPLNPNPLEETSHEVKLILNDLPEGYALSEAERNTIIDYVEEMLMDKFTKDPVIVMDDLEVVSVVHDESDDNDDQETENRRLGYTLLTSLIRKRSRRRRLNTVSIPMIITVKGKAAKSDMHLCYIMTKLADSGELYRYLEKMNEDVYENAALQWESQEYNCGDDEPAVTTPDTNDTSNIFKDATTAPVIVQQPATSKPSTQQPSPSPIKAQTQSPTQTPVLTTTASPVSSPPAVSLPPPITVSPSSPTRTNQPTPLPVTPQPTDGDPPIPPPTMKPTNQATDDDPTPSPIDLSSSSNPTPSPIDLSSSTTNPTERPTDTTRLVCSPDPPNIECDGTTQLQLVEQCSSSDTVANDQYGGAFDMTMNDGELKAVVGARFHDKTGSAYLMAYDQDTKQWNHVASFLPGGASPNGLFSDEDASYDQFGYAVAISNGWVALSAPLDTASTGKVSIYSLDTDIGGEGQIEPDFELVAADKEYQTRYGSALALDDDTLVVGADRDRGNVGSAYVYKYTNGEWIQAAKLAPTEATTDSQGNFGRSVAISQGIVVVGAPMDSTNGRRRNGSVFVYSENEMGSYVLVQQIAPADLLEGDQFGTSVAIDVFTNPTTNVRETRIAIGTPGDDDKGQESGSVSIYKRKRIGGFSFDLEQKVTVSEWSPDVQMGTSVDMDGDKIIVGAKNRIYYFQSEGPNWAPWAEKSVVAPQNTNNFGSSVAIHSLTKVVMVGSPLNDKVGEEAGVIHSYAVC